MLENLSETRRPARRWRIWCARTTIALVAICAAAKIGDIGLGWSRDSIQRHLLRMPANVEFRHRSSEFSYVFRTNSLGLRGSETTIEKPAGVYRIVIVGDSFVAGWGVPEKETFAGRLQSLLKKFDGKQVEVINLSRVGSSTVRQLDLYEYIGRRFDPDLVILAFYVGNDLLEAMQEQTRDELEAWHPDGTVRRIAYAVCPNLYCELAICRQAAEADRQFAPKSRDDIVKTLLEQAALNHVEPGTAIAHYDALPSGIREDVEQGLLSQHRVLPACYDPSRVLRSIDPPNEVFEKAWPRVVRHLDLLRQSVESDGAALAILAIPDAAQVDIAALDFDRQLGYEVNKDWLQSDGRTSRALRAWSNANHTHHLDLTDTLRNSPQRCYYRQDQHFTAEGHAAAAQAIAQWLPNTLLHRND